MHLQITVPHALGFTGAIIRIEERLAAALAKHAAEISQVDTHWIDNILTFSLNADGHKVSGNAVVGEDNVVLEIDLPWLALLAKRRIEKRITDELGEALA